MVEVVLACLAAVAAFLTGGYAFGGVRRRKAIMDLIQIREGLPRGADRNRIDVLIKSELDALVQLGDSTRRWLRGGYFAGLLFAGLAACAWMLADFFVVDVDARVVTRYVAAALCLGATLTLGLTTQEHWDLRHRGRRIVLPLILSGVCIVGTTFAYLLILGTPYHAALFARLG